MKINPVININVKDLKPDPDNPNVMTEEQMNGLYKSMELYGYLFPVIIDQNNMIVDGHHRMQVFIQFGLSEIPCIKMNFKNDAERRSLRQAVNKLHGTHDLKKDLVELEKIFSSEPELIEQLIGFTKKDLDDLNKITNIKSPDFRRQPNEIEDLIDDMGLGKTFSCEISEELYEKIRQIMKEEKIKGYDKFLEQVVHCYEKSTP